MFDKADIPVPPRFSEEQVQACRDSGDFRPLLFEWYKFTALLCNFFARIRLDSPICAVIPEIRFAVCIGLLNRCSRLMLANINLSHTGVYGETTAIVDRSIFESAVKTAWLCLKGDADAFTRYLADGMKTELEFKANIEKAIVERGGIRLVIEDRMLASIMRYIESSRLTEDQIRDAKKLPDLATMLEDIGQTRLMYIVGQKLGSHHAHGTWPSLKLHYLEMAPEGMWCPRDHDCPTHQNQYLYVSFAVLYAMNSFIGFCIKDEKDVLPFRSLLDSVTDEYLKIMREADGIDFDPAPDK